MEKLKPLVAAILLGLTISMDTLPSIASASSDSHVSSTNVKHSSKKKQAAPTGPSYDQSPYRPVQKKNLCPGQVIPLNSTGAVTASVPGGTTTQIVTTPANLESAIVPSYCALSIEESVDITASPSDLDTDSDNDTDVAQIDGTCQAFDNGQPVGIASQWTLLPNQPSTTVSVNAFVPAMAMALDTITIQCKVTAAPFLPNEVEPGNILLTFTSSGQVLVAGPSFCDGLSQGIYNSSTGTYSPTGMFDGLASYYSSLCGIQQSYSPYGYSYGSYNSYSPSYGSYSPFSPSYSSYSSYSPSYSSYGSYNGSFSKVARH